MKKTVFDEIKGEFPQSKVMIIFKYGETTDGTHITADSVIDIIANGLRRSDGRKVIDPQDKKFFLQLGSAEVVTTQTALAIGTWVMKNGGKISNYMDATALFGGAKIAEIYTSDFKKAMKEQRLSAFEAMVKFNPGFWADWKEKLLDWFKIVFSDYVSEEIVLIPVQSPALEAIYNCFKDKEQMEFKSESIFLVKKEDDGIIAIK